MANWIRYIRQNLRRRMQALLLTGLTLVLLGSAFVMWGAVDAYRSFETNNRDLRAKQMLLYESATDMEEIVLRSRAYFIYLDPNETEALNTTHTRLKERLQKLRTYPLSASETALADETGAYFDRFFKVTLPKAAAFAEKRDYDSLREMIYSHGINPINAILEDARNAKRESEVVLASESDNLFRGLIWQAAYFVAYIMLVMLLMVYLSRLLAKDISRPLSVLSSLAARNAENVVIPEHLTKRPDEIGTLSRSLRTMIRVIQEKEEELTAQNEQLLAQQEELQAQQEELEEALQKMQQNGVFLQKLNEFTRSLSHTFDKKQLLEHTIRQLTELSGMEKGIIVTTGASPEYAAFGMSRGEAARTVDSWSDGGFARALQSKRPYVRVREATDGEKGFITGSLQSCELFLPILDDKDQVSACAILTRVGRTIGEQEENDFVGFASQIALALSISDMHQNEENQRQMMLDILDTIHAGVQLTGLDGQVLQINSRMCEIFGVDPATVNLERSTFATNMDFLAQAVEEPHELIRFIKQALEGHTRHKSMRYEIKGEPKRIIEIYWEPLHRNGQKTGTLLVHRDITREFEVDRMKTELVSTVSHELRTPLASVLGFTELLLHREMRPERQRKYVKTIHHEALRLTNMINDFLDLQRIESGKMMYDMKPVNIVPIVRDVARLQQAVTDRHQIEVTAPVESVVVFGDAEKLRQAILNLIGNAVKYSPEGGKIEVRCFREGAKIRIEVEDEGLGIPQEAIPGLFDKFYRVDNSDRREIGGTGLGLAIVKEIVARHQGSIEVESVLGEGSRFCLHLPAEQPLPEPWAEEAAAASESGADGIDPGYTVNKR